MEDSSPSLEFIMRVYPVLLGVMLLADSPPQGTPGQDAPAFQARTRPLAEVPFTLHQNAIILPGVINERDTVRLLLDTGWGPLALVAAATQRLHLVVAAPDAGGLGHAQIRSLSIGEAVRSSPLVEVFPTDALAPLIGPYDGVLSTDFFRDLVLQVDYPAGVVRFFQRSPIPSPSSARATRVSVPMIFSPVAGALPFTDSVFVDGRPVRGLFDTGGAGAFVAMPRLVERAGMRPIPDSGRIAVGLLSGDTTVRLAVHSTRVGRVAIGPFSVDSPRVMIAPPQMGGSGWGHDLVIGYGFLRHYVVTFDYPGRLVTLELPVPPQSRQPNPLEQAR